VADAPEEYRVCQHTGDLEGLAGCDRVMVPGGTEPVPAFIAERVLPPPPAPAPTPGAITWRRSTYFDRPPLVPSKDDWREVRPGRR
jgi:hypothetical protein